MREIRNGKEGGQGQIGSNQRSFHGRLPYGYKQKEKRHENDKVRIIKEPYEAKVYDRIVALYLKDQSMQAIATKLDEENVKTRFGKTNWSTGVIAQILKNEAYWTGRISVKSKKADGGLIYYSCPKLITEARWRDIQDRISGAKKRKGSPGVGAKEFLLHGLLRCGFCGSTLRFRSLYHKKAEEARVYYCNWKRCSKAALKSRNNMDRCPLPFIPAEEIEKQVYGTLMWYICGEVYGLPFIPVHEIEPALNPAGWNARINNLESEIRQLNNMREMANRLIDRAEKMLKGELDDSPSCRALLKKADAEIMEVDAKLSEAQAELDRCLKRREEKRMLEDLRQNPPETLAKIHKFLMQLPIAKKQALIRGMLSGEKKIKVWVPEDGYWGEPEPPPRVWNEETEEYEDGDYEDRPPEKLTWRDGLSPQWTFNPKVLQELLPEELNP